MWWKSLSALTLQLELINHVLVGIFWGVNATWFLIFSTSGTTNIWKNFIMDVDIHTLEEISELTVKEIWNHINGVLTVPHAQGEEIVFGPLYCMLKPLVLKIFGKLDRRDLPCEMEFGRWQILGGSERGMNKTHVVLFGGLITTWWRDMATDESILSEDFFCNYQHLCNWKNVMEHFMMQLLTRLWHQWSVVYVLVLLMSNNKKQPISGSTHFQMLID